MFWSFKDTVMSVRGGGLRVTMLTCWGSLLLLLGPACDGAPVPSQREALRCQETSRQTGGRVVLTAAERRLDARLRTMMEREMSREPFPPSVHFFRAKPLIEESPVFRLLQKMPKGDLWWPLKHKVPLWI
ncbi:hypothetical protein NHX12_020795 [Muraenolepis orangiensis]|uniref:Adenosine/AMP deaminase N-terminal domain-containing protein n=1 Tax=Muraenolepis orangiensis TaxID=630683 RepID=A0A9Q0IW42_9TELE|nr:hypothetical protein NHX12_020795 [Muraenolepis orangiensis]